MQFNWRYLQINCRYLQILSIWRYLQLNWRYLQFIWRLSANTPIWRYLQFNWIYLQFNWRYLQINSVNKCETGARRFHIYSLNCRYLQFIWRYLQFIWRYIQIQPIWRYLQIGVFGDICNWIGDILNWIGDISNSIADMCTSIGDICNWVNKCENGAPYTWALWWQRIVYENGEEVAPKFGGAKGKLRYLQRWRRTAFQLIWYSTGIREACEWCPSTIGSWQLEAPSVYPSLV